MNIGIANDHRGYELKQKVTNYLTKKGYNVINYGTDSKENADYPDYAFKLCEGITQNEIIYGIAICGTGIGISIACNKVKGIRCAKVCNDKEAKLCRLHNDANVIALNSSMNILEVKDILDAFLTTKFSEEDRHIKRIEKITKYEEKNER
ncbi:MAG: ribose 5-phosphate isomerase B [Firmicutes bacterium]|nr:ribose 5-phosphate isomerase B [Bacillota bacterium]